MLHTATTYGDRLLIAIGIAALPMARRDTEFGGNLLVGLARSAPLVRAAQLTNDVLRGMPLPTSHLYRPFQPDNRATGL